MKESGWRFEFLHETWKKIKNYIAQIILET